MLNQEDAARIEAAIRRRFDAFHDGVYGDLHALVRDGALNQEYKGAFDHLAPECTRLTARAEELERENAALLLERGALSAHLETVATERDGPMERVMEGERDVLRLLSLFRDVRTFLEACTTASIAARNKVLFVSLPTLCDEALGDKVSGHDEAMAVVRAYLERLRRGPYDDGIGPADLRGGDDA